jgi:hypothetical protein
MRRRQSRFEVQIARSMVGGTDLVVCVLCCVGSCASAQLLSCLIQHFLYIARLLFFDIVT